MGAKYPISLWMVALGVVISFVGFFLGNALITGGIILIGLSIGFDGGYRRVLTFKKENYLFYGYILFFILLMISGLWSEDDQEFLRALRRKLPFLIVPMALMALKDFKKEIYLVLLIVFFITLSIVNLKLFFQYFIDIDQLHQMYKEGRVVDTPMFHVRYSLLCAYNVFVGGYLIQEERLKNWQKIPIVLGLVFGFLFVHLLAVRTGMAALYSGIIAVTIGYIIHSKKYLLGIGMSAIMVLGLVLAINMIPTLKNKWHYTLYSIREMQNNRQIERLSDSYRLGSISAGIHIGNQSPIIGVGLGDVKPLTKQYVKKHYPAIAHEIFTPQSQYVMTYASLGIIGLFLFLIISIFPIVQGWRIFDINVIGLHALLVGSFIVEQTMEDQLGTAFAILFGMLSYKNICIKKNENMWTTSHSA